MLAGPVGTLMWFVLCSEKWVTKFCHQLISLHSCTVRPIELHIFQFTSSYISTLSSVVHWLLTLCFFTVLCKSFLLYFPSFQAVSIADKQVFAFRMLNHTGATEGDAYLDMSNVDTSVTLEVGCIEVIFLNKFVSSILVRITSLWTDLGFVYSTITGFKIILHLFFLSGIH